MTKSLFIGFMEKMLGFPLWIKQTIFLNLTKDLNDYLTELEERKNEIKQKLEEFSAISTRENSLAKYINENFSINAKSISPVEVIGSWIFSFFTFSQPALFS